MILNVRVYSGVLLGLLGHLTGDVYLSRAWAMRSGGRESAVNSATQAASKTLLITEVDAGKPIQIFFQLKPGWKLNSKAPHRLSLYSGNRPDQRILIFSLEKTELLSQKVELPRLAKDGVYQVETRFYFCQSTAEGVCRLETDRFDLQAVKGIQAPSQITFEVPRELPLGR